MPRVGKRVMSLDTETTGVDFRHGARPFFVTMCDDKQNVYFWEWEVDPNTRTIIKKTDEYDLLKDLVEIKKLVKSLDKLVLQNARFDYTALRSLYKELGLEFFWDWDKVHDTLVSAHLINSKLPKDLTTLALTYLGLDIQPLETELKRACHDSRRMVRSLFKNWRIAKEGDPTMPGVKGSISQQKKNKGAVDDSPWKMDTWLPQALARVKKLKGDHGWWNVLKEYANADSAVTLPIHEVHMEIIAERGLEKIYEARRVVTRLAYTLEENGVTVKRSRLKELQKEYIEETKKNARICRTLGGWGACQTCKGGTTAPKTKACKTCGGSGRVELLAEMPKSVSNALRIAVFDNLNLPKFERYDRKKKSDLPSMDKFAMEWWLTTLPATSKQYHFIKNLASYRKRTTALSFMASYEKFGLEIPETDYLQIHPSLNPTATDTLRWSSTNPCEQNISKKEGFNLRYCFGPLPGREWWSIDANNIELRIPAYESGEEEFIALFERPDEPPYFGSNHLLISHLLHTKEFEECINEEGQIDGRIFKKRYASSKYQKVKNGNFAVQYGSIDREGGQGTADQAYGLAGAQSKIKKRFTKQEELNLTCIRLAERQGYVETMPDKTVDPTQGYPLQCTRTDYGRILPTVPLNYHVQGTAMWWMMKAQVRCQKYLDKINQEKQLRSSLDLSLKNVKEQMQRLGFRMILQVHDELVFDFPGGKGPEENLPIIRNIAKLMEEGGNDIGIPTPVSVEYHTESWSEGQSVKL